MSGVLWMMAVACGLGTAWPAAEAAEKTVAQGYRNADQWLCRPGRQDACAVDQTATVVAADGAMARERLVVDPAPPIDCFYVYPTISEDPAGNSSLSPGPGERRAVAQQFARFASVCRPFAPMYRQITLAGLRSYFSGGSLVMDPELAYGDVAAAWRDYMTHDNGGRGVVLIGHSQGARMLGELIRREIEGSPDRARVVSALLIGFNVEVPENAVVGGSFKQMPLCETVGQTGCIVSYVSFRAGTPPSAASRFGRSSKPGVRIACTDPVALSGGDMRPYFVARESLLGDEVDTAAWQSMVKAAGTPFVSLPGKVSGRCVRGGDGSGYFAVSVTPAPDARPADIPGDLVVAGIRFDDWGLHLVDVNLAVGNLLDIVRRQSAAFAQRAAR